MKPDYKILFATAVAVIAFFYFRKKSKCACTIG